MCVYFLFIKNFNEIRNKIYGCIFPNKYFVLSIYKVFCLLALIFLWKNNIFNIVLIFLNRVNYLDVTILNSPFHSS